MSLYVCLTAGEWRNLCSMGRIRLHKDRTVSDQEQSGSCFYDMLFSLAPDRFSIGETSDFLITECKNLKHEIDGITPPGQASGMCWLALEDVVRFFPIRLGDAWTFESDAHNAKIILSAAEFEPHWNIWFKSQIVDQGCMNGLALMRNFQLYDLHSLDEKMLEKWRRVALLATDLDTVLVDDAELSIDMIRNRKRLFDLVRQDADSAAIFVSCPIEWINLRSGGNILDTDGELADRAHHLHEKYLKIPFDPVHLGAEDLVELRTLLCARAPGAFSDEWTPAVVSLYARYFHQIQFGSVSPDDVLAAVTYVDGQEGRRAAGLLAFLLGVALGSNKVHELERLMHQERFEVSEKLSSAEVKQDNEYSDALVSQEPQFEPNAPVSDGDQTAQLENVPSNSHSASLDEGDENVTNLPMAV